MKSVLFFLILTSIYFIDSKTDRCYNALSVSSYEPCFVFPGTIILLSFRVQFDLSGRVSSTLKRFVSFSIVHDFNENSLIINNANSKIKTINKLNYNTLPLLL